MYPLQLSFLTGTIVGVLISWCVFSLAYRKYKKQTEAVLDSVRFSRRRKNRPPFEEAISVAMSSKLKEQLVRVSGNDQSKYVRASLRLSLPTLKALPSLVDILDKE